MNFVCSWSMGMGVVATDDVRFDTLEKVAPGFSFDELVYDSRAGIAFRMLDGEQIPLTAEEIAACEEYCRNYADLADYPVQAWEAETGLWRGTMPKSEAVAAGLEYALEPAPDFPVAKRVKGKWVRVECVILENGMYRLKPDSVCSSCVLFLSEAEWAAWPKPAKSTEVWDFATETWTDYRTLEKAQTTADEWIRQVYAAKRAAVVGQIPLTEMMTWTRQREEARAWLENPDEETPFLDAVLVAQAESGMEESKAELVEKILAHDGPESAAAQGAVHGEARAWLMRVWACQTLEEVDATTAAMAEALGISSLIRPLAGF